MFIYFLAKKRKMTPPRLTKETISAMSPSELVDQQIKTLNKIQTALKTTTKNFNDFMLLIEPDMDSKPQRSGNDSDSSDAPPKEKKRPRKKDEAEPVNPVKPPIKKKKVVTIDTAVATSTD